MTSEKFKLFFSAFLNDLNKFTWKNHWGSLTPEAKFSLDVPHDMTKVDMKKLPTLLDHDVVVVPVPDAEHVHGHRVPSAGQHEVVQGRFQVFRVRVLS